MGLFNSKINIGEGKKYDVSQVSTEGISAEERAELEKKNRKLIDVFKAFDQDGDGSLSKLELAAAMDAFSKMDTDKSDNKLSKKELEAGAEGLNAFFKSQGKDVDMDADGLKTFMKAVRKLTKNDEKVSTSEALDEIRMLNQQEQERIDAANKAEQERQAQEAEKLRQAQEAEKLKQEQEAQEAARLKDLQTPKNYTVQLNDRLDDILKKSLEAQGIEVTDETMAEAKAEFIKNNPKALHGPKGKEYLYAGDVIKIPGNLKGELSADEVKAKYLEIINKKAGKDDVDVVTKTDTEVENAAANENKPAVTDDVVIVADAPKKKGPKTRTSQEQYVLDGVVAGAGYRRTSYNKYIYRYDKDNLKYKALTPEEQKLLIDEIKTNPDYAAEVLYRASVGAGTSENLWDIVMENVDDVNQFKEIDKALKKNHGNSLSYYFDDEFSWDYLNATNGKDGKTFKFNTFRNYIVDQYAANNLGGLSRDGSKCTFSDGKVYDVYTNKKGETFIAKCGESSDISFVKVNIQGRQKV